MGMKLVLSIIVFSWIVPEFFWGIPLLLSYYTFAIIKACIATAVFETF